MWGWGISFGGEYSKIKEKGESHLPPDFLVSVCFFFKYTKALAKEETEPTEGVLPARLSFIQVFVFIHLQLIVADASIQRTLKDTETQLFYHASSS